jgi:hypothetical protein
MTYKILAMGLSLLIVPLLHSQQNENEQAPQKQQSSTLDKTVIEGYLMLRNFINPIIVTSILNKIGTKNPTVGIASQCAFDIASHVAAHKYLDTSKKTSAVLKGGAAFAAEGVVSKAIETGIEKVSTVYFPETQHVGLLDIIKGRALLTALGLNYQNVKARTMEILHNDVRLHNLNAQLLAPISAMADELPNESQNIDILKLKLFFLGLHKAALITSNNRISDLLRSGQIALQAHSGIKLDFLVSMKAATQCGLSMLASSLLQKWA